MSKYLLPEIRKGRTKQVFCKNKECSSFRFCSRIPSEIVGTGEIKYLFVGPPPSLNEYFTKRPFTSSVGMTIRNIIAYAKREEGKSFTYALTHVCKHSDTDLVKRTPQEKEKDTKNCRNILLKEIESYSPKIIVLFGMGAIKTLFPKTTIDLDREHGTYIVFNGVKCYITYNPGAFFNNPDKFGDIFYDLCYLFGRRKPKIEITYGDDSCDRSYKILTNYKDIQNSLNKMYKSKNPIILDIEADSLNRLENRVLTIQLYGGGKYAYIIPWAHPESPFTHDGININRKLLNKFLDGKGKYPYIVGHNLKFDYTVCLNSIGVYIKATLMDTLGCAYMLDETHTKDDGDDADEMGATGGYGLGSQLIKYGFYDDWYFKAKNNRSNLANESLDYVARYGGGDVVLNYELLRCQLIEAKNQNYSKFSKFLTSFYDEQIRLFKEIETNGVAINLEYLGKLMSQEESPLLQFISKVEKILYNKKSVIKANKLLTSNQKSVFGDLWMFDINKPDHARMLFFDVLRLKPLSYGKLKDGSKGAPSLDKNFIKYYEHIPEVGLLKKLRRAKQLYGLYPKAFHNRIATSPDCIDGRIRSDFKGFSTRSGRASSAHPNIQQNIRLDGSELVDIVRGLYTSPPNKVLIKLDIMANEIRGWGSIALDPVLKNIVLHGFNLRKKYFKRGTDKQLYKKVKLEGDLHRSNAAAFYTKDIAKVTDEERQDSKNTTFGTVYGLSDTNLAKRLKKTVEETREIKKKFFSTLSEGKKWLDESAEFAKDNLYVESPLGRRRRLWHFLASPPLDPNSSSPKLIDSYRHDYFKELGVGKILRLHGMGRRRAMNTPIQALGSDIAFLGAFIIRRYIHSHELHDWKLYNVVHDSLEAEIPVKDIAQYIMVAKLSYEVILKEYLKKEFGYDLYIPVEVDFEIGFEGNKVEKWDGSLTGLHDLHRKYKVENKKRYSLVSYN